MNFYLLLGMDFRLGFCLHPVLTLPNTKVYRTSELIEKPQAGETRKEKGTVLPSAEQTLRRTTEVNQVSICKHYCSMYVRDRWKQERPTKQLQF